MYKTLFENKHFTDIVKHSVTCDLYLSTTLSGELTKDQIFSIIQSHGLLKNLILFHLNEYINLDDLELLQIIFKSFDSNDRTKLYDFKIFDYKSLQILYKYLFKHKNFIITEKNKDNIIQLLLTIISTFNIPYLELKEMFEVLNPIVSNEDLVTLWTFWDESGENDKSMRCLLNLSCTLSKVSYEVTEDYIIAYKGVKKDNSSTISDRIKYFPNITYTSPCDDDMFNENSFGLSAWDYKNAKIYCSEKILKVKIYFNHLRYINIQDSKLRATTFTVLEELT